MMGDITLCYKALLALSLTINMIYTFKFKITE